MQPGSPMRDADAALADPDSPVPATPAVLPVRRSSVASDSSTEGNNSDLNVTSPLVSPRQSLASRTASQVPTGSLRDAADLPYALETPSPFQQARHLG
ncbi:hypothetical protein CYMTET_2989 [Cymbomonas tetramitiformis]|uniref:Uncharacterized protein n=1 Tax=Cymbomonas tetramitiformis TaxID=36881 RepID=A0AAE0H452_9CHLO|nr:hypothetical protein CYMTET_2989 [Cymbomonas tetramitiformis]